MTRTPILVDAGEIRPPEAVLPRTWSPAPCGPFDALHLANALRLGGDVDGIVVYDARLAEAARTRGLDVLAPA